MRYRWENIVFVVYMLTLSLHTFASGTSDHFKIPFERQAGLILISANVDNQEGKFIFDTGANGLLLNYKYGATESGIVLSTLQGDISADAIKVRKLQMGQYVIQNLNAFAADLSSVEDHVGSKILGVIGAKMLDSDVLFINIETRTLELCKKTDLKHYFNEDPIQVPVVFQNDVPVIQLRFNNKLHHFILDTGASVSLIDIFLLEDNSKLFNPTGKDFELITANNKSTVYRYYNTNAIMLDRHVIEGLSVAAINLSYLQDMFEMPISGILSIEDLPVSSVMLDYKKGLFYLN